MLSRLCFVLLCAAVAQPSYHSGGLAGEQIQQVEENEADAEQVNMEAQDAQQAYGYQGDAQQASGYQGDYQYQGDQGYYEQEEEPRKSMFGKVKSFIKNHLPGHHSGGNAGEEVEFGYGDDAQYQQGYQQDAQYQQGYQQGDQYQQGYAQDEQQADQVEQDVEDEQSSHAGGVAGSIEESEDVENEAEVSQTETENNELMEMIQDLHSVTSQAMESMGKKSGKEVALNQHAGGMAGSVEEASEMSVEQLEAENAKLMNAIQDLHGMLAKHSAVLEQVEKGSVEEASEATGAELEAETAEETAEVDNVQNENADLMNVMQDMHSVLAKNSAIFSEKSGGEGANHHAGGMAGSVEAESEMTDAQLEAENSQLMNVIQDLHGMLAKHSAVLGHATAPQEATEDAVEAEAEVEPEQATSHAGGVAGSAEEEVEDAAAQEEVVQDAPAEEEVVQDAPAEEEVVEDAIAQEEVAVEQATDAVEEASAQEVSNEAAAAVTQKVAPAKKVVQVTAKKAVAAPAKKVVEAPAKKVASAPEASKKVASVHQGGVAGSAEVEDAPAQEEVVEDAPAQEEVVEDAPAQEEVVEESPAQEEVVEDAPAQEEVVEDAPAQEELSTQHHSGGVSGSVEASQTSELSDDELEEQNEKLQQVIKELHDMLGKTFGTK